MSLPMDARRAGGSYGNSYTDFVPSGLPRFAGTSASNAANGANFLYTKGDPTHVSASQRPSSSTHPSYAPSTATTRPQAPQETAEEMQHAYTATQMKPLLHLTSHATNIIAMEYSSHNKLLAIATSKNEVLVTETAAMPSGGTAPLETPEVALPQLGYEVESSPGWDPTYATTLVDRLRVPCTQLLWAPWQHGVYLGVFTPTTRQIRLYRFSHRRWVLEESVSTPEGFAFSFSSHFTIAMACAKGSVAVLARHPPQLATEAPTGTGAAWFITSSFEDAVPAEHPGNTDAGGGYHGPNSVLFDDGHETSNMMNSAASRDCLCVGWEDSGALLAVGDKSGRVRVFLVGAEGTQLHHVVYEENPQNRLSGSVRQVVWSPSAGRSFLMMAVVYPYRVTVFIFRRARSSQNASVRAVNKDGTPIQLQMVATATVTSEEISKLSWNTTGTRFITAHTDSSVHVWDVDIRYQNYVRKPSATDAGGAEVGKEKGGDPKLELVVTVRKTSSVHPYHAAGR